MINFYCVRPRKSLRNGCEWGGLKLQLNECASRATKYHRFVSLNICIYSVDLHFSVDVFLVPGPLLVIQTLNWGDINANWGPLKSHKVKQQEEEKILRNNNVTQRFIECNKRNKYRGFCCEIKKFVYDARTIFIFFLCTWAKKCAGLRETLEKRYEKKEQVITFWHSFSILNILIFS